MFKFRITRTPASDNCKFGGASFQRPAALKRVAAILGAAALSLSIVAPASATAIVTRVTVTSSGSEANLPDDCRPGITGTIVATDVFSYQRVDSPQGFHFEGTDTATGRITWSDGTYTIIESVDHTAFNSGQGTTILANAHEDSGNTYTADGVFLFRTTFHLVEHFTVVAGVVRVEFVRNHIHFFEGC